MCNIANSSKTIRGKTFTYDELYSRAKIYIYANIFRNVNSLAKNPLL